MNRLKIIFYRLSFTFALLFLRAAQAPPMHPDGRYPIFYALVKNMKLYKTINTSFHAGHLYEHCMWTAQVIDEWFERYNQNNNDQEVQWVAGIPELHRKKIVLAAFLHDIGKASNQTADGEEEIKNPPTLLSDASKNKLKNKPYYIVGNKGYFDTATPILHQYPYFDVIRNHPRVGFEMILPEADGNPDSEEDFFLDTPITPDNLLITKTDKELVADALKKLKEYFSSIKSNEENIITQKFLSLKNTDYEDMSIKNKVLSAALCPQFSQSSQGYLQSMIRRIIEQPSGTITAENLMAGKRIMVHEIFQELGFSDEDRKFIAVLIGIHWYFGVPVVSDYSTINQKKTEKAYESFLEKLSALALDAQYNNGIVDDLLLRCAILIGAADVKGSSVHEPFNNFLDRYEWFSENKTLFEKPSEHGMYHCLPKFDYFKFGTKGLQAREDFLKYFEKNYPNGYLENQDRSKKLSTVSVLLHKLKNSLDFLKNKLSLLKEKLSILSKKV